MRFNGANERRRRRYREDDDVDEGQNSGFVFPARHIPASRRNGHSEILIVLGSRARGYVSLAWTGGIRPPSNRMHRDIAWKPTESAGIGSPTRFPSRSQTGFHVRETTLLTDGQFHVREESSTQQVRAQDRLRKETPAPSHGEFHKMRDHVIRKSH